MTGTNELPPNAIAVIGMAGRFPGADSVSAFWDNLARGQESITTLTEDELLAEGVTAKALANPAYVRRAALIDGLDQFDADFFGYTAQSARMTDPQHRLFLQSAWHAFEDAGYDPAEIEAAVGVFATSTTSGYLLHNIMSNHDPKAIIGQGVSFDMVNLSMQNDKDYLATKAAYQFNLRGPALSVQTACSSALVAVHLACQSILNGECDIALAGGASLRIPHRVGYWYDPGSMVSPTGHCRPFDVRSDGTIFSSGVGAVILKAFDAAVEDGDRIHAVIRGSAINNDGSTKMTYAAPNAAGQADVIAEAHAVADVDASTVSYIETHGTGTPLGDPIEVEGLRQAFEVSELDRQGPCYLGSVKSNIGHLESAAGIAGLIKTILCLKHRAIPATLHYTSPNPELHLERGPFEVRSEHGPWEWDGIRRAGVSSFGVGGTNAHVVLEEAPRALTLATRPGPQVLLLSARTASALQDAKSALGKHLSGIPAEDLGDVAHTLTRRRCEPMRLSAVVHDREDAVAVLSQAEHDRVSVDPSVTGPLGSDRVAFLFPGQGAQHVGMARGLYDTEPVFAENFDLCAEVFDGELDIDLRAEIFEGNARNLERTDRTQPALFTVQYAMAKLLESFGIRPYAMAGHSIGEYAAAALAGVFDVTTAARVVSMRARLMNTAPRGVMVAVASSPDAIAEYLTGEVDVAAINDPNACVVAGTDATIKAFTERLAAAGITARRVRTSHAFHSRLMESMVPEFTGFLSRLTLAPPRIPLLSNVTGSWLSDSEAVDPTTWARQVRATVRFADELDTLLSDPTRVLVEVGPGGTLTASAMRHPKWGGGHRAIRTMRHHAQNREDRDAFLQSLGQLWAAGVEVDWTPLQGDRQPTLVTLPGYPFERQRHWVEHNSARQWLGSTSAIQAGAAAQDENRPGVNGVVAEGVSPVEETLRRIWTQCLGVASIERTANFFELGGDSLVAISVAMAAANEGLDLTPQDLYDNPTVEKLGALLNTRYAAGGLARPALLEVVNPPVTPNVAYFLENGCADRGRWRVPVVFRLNPAVRAADAQAVLDAVVAHHDALRRELSHHAGVWEQRFTEREQTVAIITASLPDGIEAGSPTEQAVLDILDAHTDPADLAPLIAVLVEGAPERPHHLVLGLHGTVADAVSRETLLGDVFAAFGQRLAGEEIALAAVSTSWSEWSQRSASLAAHPAVVESRGHWLDTSAKASATLANPAAEPPQVSDYRRVATVLTAQETGELDNARRRVARPVEEVLLAALSRTLGRTGGEGIVAVHLDGAGRSVLKPEVDVRRTVGWFTSVHPIALACSAAEPGPGTAALDHVAAELAAIPHYGISYGLLRHLYAPTAPLLSADRADLHFVHGGALPELPALPADAPVHLVSDAATLMREERPGLGHAIEVRVYRSSGELHADWWYDVRRVSADRAEQLATGYLASLVALARALTAEDDIEAGSEGLSLVELT